MSRDRWADCRNWCRGKGYDIHHIVEQTPADQDGFPRHLISRGENLVRSDAEALADQRVVSDPK
jgi:hypothetical protein